MNKSEVPEKIYLISETFIVNYDRHDFEDIEYIRSDIHKPSLDKNVELEKKLERVVAYLRSLRHGLSLTGSFDSLVSNVDKVIIEVEGDQNEL